jgi:hypothetical protein
LPPVGGPTPYLCGAWLGVHSLEYVLPVGQLAGTCHRCDFGTACVCMVVRVDLCLRMVFGLHQCFKLAIQWVCFVCPCGSVCFGLGCVSRCCSNRCVCGEGGVLLCLSGSCTSASVVSGVLGTPAGWDVWEHSLGDRVVLIGVGRLCDSVCACHCV